MKKTLLLFTLAWFMYLPSFSQFVGGGGPLEDQTSLPNMQGGIDSLSYDFELYPNQAFDGKFYFWKVGGVGTRTGRFGLALNTGVIVNFSPNRISSDTCSDIKAIDFNWVAPSQTGSYRVVLTDSNQNWPPVSFKILVTTTPTSFLPARNETVEVGMSKDITQLVAYLPQAASCVNQYAPANSTTFRLDIFPASNWITLRQSPLTINLLQTSLVTATLTPQVVGQFTAYAMSAHTWFSKPLFLQINLTATDPVSTKPKVDATSTLRYWKDNDRLVINSTSGSRIHSVQLVTATGSIVKNTVNQLSSDQLEIPFTGLSMGIYFVRVTTDNQQVVSFKTFH